MKSATKSYQVLQSAFQRKALNVSGYSKNVLAKDLKVSGAFITNMLSGKRPIPFERLKDIFRCLELDIHERQAVVRLLIKESAGAQVADSLNFEPSPAREARQSFHLSKADLLSHWWHLVVLEGFALDGGRIDLETLQKRLGLSSRQVDETLRVLTELDLVEQVDGHYRKKEKHLYVPTGRSRKDVRSYHEQMINKARTELMTKTTDQDFHRRLITGFTFAVNGEKIEEAKSRLLEVLNAFSQSMSTDAGTDVYQCNVQFFPLTASPAPPSGASPKKGT